MEPVVHVTRALYDDYTLRAVNQHALKMSNNVTSPLDLHINAVHKYTGATASNN